MGKVNRLRNRVEPFAVLFWALGGELANIWPCLHAGPALLNRRTQSMSFYGHIVSSILNEDAFAPFAYLGTVCYLSMTPAICLCWCWASSLCIVHTRREDGQAGSSPHPHHLTFLSDDYDLLLLVHKLSIDVQFLMSFWLIGAVQT